MLGPKGELGVWVEVGTEGEDQCSGEAERAASIGVGADQLLPVAPGEEGPPPRPPPGAADAPRVPAAAGGAPTQPHPCLPGLGSGLGTWHLA